MSNDTVPMQCDIVGMLRNLNTQGMLGFAYKFMVYAADDGDEPTLSEAKALLERLIAEGETDYFEYLRRRQ